MPVVRHRPSRAFPDLSDLRPTSRTAARRRLRWRLPAVQRLAAGYGWRVEKLVLQRGNVVRYAVFRDRSLRDALDATFYPRLEQVVVAVTPSIGV